MKSIGAALTFPLALALTASQAIALDQVFEKPREVGEWGKQLVQYFTGDELGYSRSYALVIGISEFEHFTSLPTAKDPIRIKDYLLSEAGFDYVHLLTEEDATPERIRALMEDDFTSRVGERDRFVFYWSGHGHTLKDRFGKKRGYLPTASAAETQTSRMVSMERLREWDERLLAKQVVYLLDSCFSGHAGSRPQSYARKLSLSVMAKPSRHILTAGTENEETIALDRLEGSVFTHAILEGLRGGAEVDGRFEPDGLISMNELERFVQLRVEELRREVGWRKSITPKLWDFGSNAGEFFFVSPTVKTAALSAQGLEFTGHFKHGVPMSVGMSLGEARTRQEVYKLRRQLKALETRLEQERDNRLDRIAQNNLLEREIRTLEAKLAEAKFAAGELAETIQDERVQHAKLVTELEDELHESKLAFATSKAALEKATKQSEQTLTLLAAARSAVDKETDRAKEAEMQVSILNSQISALRVQLGQLQDLLDQAKTEDSKRDEQLQSLGTHLNTALARVASEERKRRQLEEAERKRLEDEASLLAIEFKRIRSQMDPLAETRSEFLNRVEMRLSKSGVVQVDRNRVVLASAGLFRSSRAELTYDGAEVVKRVALELQGVLLSIASEQNVDWVLQVDGHTDAIPMTSSVDGIENNWELSQARALSVVRYMVDVLGFNPARLSANGFGEHRPIADNSSSLGRAQNRRIEFRLMER